MAIGKGFKQTDVGVIPNDWYCAQVGQLATTSSGTTPSRSSYDRYFKNGSINWVKTLDLNNGIISITDEKVTAEALDETSLSVFPVDTVLVAMYGGFMQIGRTGILAIPACVNQALTAIKCNKANLYPAYLLWVLNHRVEYWKSVASSSRKDPNITSKEIREFPLPLPPTLTEQNAIAGALSDADAWIESLEQLIAKKRQIKQGAMRELLTGERRLPGFSGKWETKRLGDVLSVRHGKSQSEIAVENGCYPILASGGEIGRTNTALYSGPSVLIGRKGTIDAPQYSDSPFWSVDTLFFTEIQNDHCAKWLYYRFCLVQWRTYNEASGVPSLNARTIEAIELVLPELKEQTAIATVLSDMDTEIESLESKLAKAREIKQGMMQELLTGRIRLV